MPAMEIGRICIKTLGREAGKKLKKAGKLEEMNKTIKQALS
ncbi:MAG: hypothetical protein P8Y18_09475 [Candidatus Bathyarchaeota archaeon]